MYFLIRLLKRFAFVLLVLFAVGFVRGVWVYVSLHDKYGDQTGLAMEMDRADRRDVQALYSLLEKNMSVPASRDAMAMWLGERIEAHNPQPYYSFYYALVQMSSAAAIAAGGQKDRAVATYKDAFQALMNFRTIGIIDAARCTDVSITSTVRTLFGYKLAELKKAAPEVLEGSADMAQKMALEYEQAIANRVPNKAICGGGMARMSASLNNKPYTVQFVADEVWQARREELRQLLSK